MIAAVVGARDYGERERDPDCDVHVHRLNKVLDAARERLGVDHIALLTWQGAGWRAGDWALRKGLPWTHCGDDPAAMFVQLDIGVLLAFPNGGRVEQEAIQHAVDSGIPVHRIDHGKDA